MATKCAINGRQWGAYDGRRQSAGEPAAIVADRDNTLIKRRAARFGTT